MKLFVTRNFHPNFKALNMGYDGSLETGNASSSSTSQLDHSLLQEFGKQASRYLLAKLDGPVITNSAATLPIQARDAYIDERDRATAYTRPFFSDLVNNASSSSNAPTHEVRVEPSFTIPSLIFEQGGCIYCAGHANGE